MARIRYIKPDFFDDEDLAELPCEIRLFFAGLWCYADKAGRLEDRPLKLKVKIMPYSPDFDAEKALQILSQHKKHSPDKSPFIVRYEVENNKYIQILKWEKHQKPHHTEAESVIPPMPISNKESSKESMGMEKGTGTGSVMNTNMELDKRSLTVKEPLNIGFKDKEGVVGGEEKIKEIMTSWNEFADRYKLPKIQSIIKESKRERHLRARFADKNFSFEALLKAVEKSPFLLGLKTDFKATFDWIILPSNYQKIIEGNYFDSLQSPSSKQNPDLLVGSRAPFDSEEFKRALERQHQEIEEDEDV